jgi:hypothetical protein
VGTGVRRPGVLSLLIPLSLLLWNWLKPKNPNMVTAFTLCGLGYLLFCAVGAAIFAVVLSTVADAYAQASGTVSHAGSNRHPLPSLGTGGVHGLAQHAAAAVCYNSVWRGGFWYRRRNGEALGAGDVLLAEDLTGQGHTLRVVSKKARVSIAVPLA